MENENILSFVEMFHNLEKLCRFGAVFWEQSYAGLDSFRRIMADLLRQF